MRMRLLASVVCVGLAGFVSAPSASGTAALTRGDLRWLARVTFGIDGATVIHIGNHQLKATPHILERELFNKPLSEGAGALVYHQIVIFKKGLFVFIWAYFRNGFRNGPNAAASIAPTLVRHWLPGTSVQYFFIIFLTNHWGEWPTPTGENGLPQRHTTDCFKT